MKVLMISGDPAVLDSSSDIGKRTEEYRRVLGELDILLCAQNIRSFIAGFWQGYIMMRKKTFDVITAQGPEHWFLAWLFSKIFRIPWQAQIHTEIFSPYFWQESLKNKLRVFLAKFLLSKADSIRVVSERIKSSLKIEPRVLPIFVDVKKIQSARIKTDLRQKYPNYDFIVLMASRLTREKNIGLAIEAMQTVVKKYPKALLLVVGEGPEKKKLQAASYKLQANIKFEPWTKDLVSYYKTADLFLLTSNYEGYGRTVVEAMAAGLPVVMTDVGLAGEILIDDLDGLVVPVGNVQALLSAILLLRGNPEKRATFIREAERVVNSLPTRQDYLNAYKNALTFKSL